MGGLSQKVAGWLAGSALFRPGRDLFERNRRDWNLPLSKWQKLWSGGWLILRDYADGRFPPRYACEEAAHQAEDNYRFSIPGVSEDQVAREERAKPFWFGPPAREYLGGFVRVTECLERAGLRPPARVLELGCGSGWMAEFLCLLGFRVVATTLSEHEVRNARHRIRSVQARGLAASLDYLAAPMERVDQATSAQGPFDAVLVYEALHHAFDWKQSLASAHRCLKEGGWLLICNEPNWLHTFVAHRTARLTQTHEVGFSRRALRAELRRAGFGRIVNAGPRWGWLIRPHWLLARK